MENVQNNVSNDVYFATAYSDLTNPLAEDQVLTRYFKNFS